MQFRASPVRPGANWGAPGAPDEAGWSEAGTGLVGMGGYVSKLTGAVTGRRIKYLVILFWLVMVAVAGPLAGKLNGVEKNDAKSWLPGSAESTQVLTAEAAFSSPNTLPAVVVYERPAG